jgi:hypothetical protein
LTRLRANVICFAGWVASLEPLARLASCVLLLMVTYTHTAFGDALRTCTSVQIAFIAQCFQHSTMEEILDAVQKFSHDSNKHTAAFANKTLQTLCTMSPTALKATLEQASNCHSHDRTTKLSGHHSLPACLVTLPRVLRTCFNLFCRCTEANRSLWQNASKWKCEWRCALLRWGSHIHTHRPLQKTYPDRHNPA